MFDMSILLCDKNVIYISFTSIIMLIHKFYITSYVQRWRHLTVALLQVITLTKETKKRYENLEGRRKTTFPSS